ncbi:MAG: PGF-pre-PGF domain-containing protein, partial [Candidatus Aenigmatarchaeota archaeon]
NTTYYYNVTSCDASGNCNTTGPHSFVTLPALLPNGSPCSKASECEGGYCVHGVCRSAATYCGDGYCDSGETSSSCPSDCPRVGTKSVPGGIQVHEVSEEGYLLRQFVYASAGAQIRIDLSAARSPLMMLEVMAAAYVPMGYIEFVELDIAPILEQLEFYTSRTTVVPIAPRLYTPAMAQIVYSAFSVEFVDGRSSIGEITFRFKVAKSWLDEKSADYKTIRLLRNEGESWTALDTHLDGEDEEYYYYSAVSSDLSMYAIVATSPQALCAACASGDWSPCVSGTQTRAVAECGAHTGYACHYAIESRACELPSPTPAALAPVPELPPGSIDFAISILALAAAFCYFRLTELCRKPGKSKR